MDLMETVLEQIIKYVKIGGGLWVLWGAIVLGLALRDKTGPQIQSGIWQMVGGGLVLAVSTLFSTIIA